MVLGIVGNSNGIRLEIEASVLASLIVNLVGLLAGFIAVPEAYLKLFI
jgi:hypothetical protein